jgi:hypothetical protein
VNLEEFKQATCAKPACWERESFVEGGVQVDLGSGWNAFMLDRHFANKHRCVGARGRKGELCDAIALPDQNPNRKYRLIEAKAGGLSSKAARQLQNGAAYLEGIIGKCRRNRLTAEVHTGSAVAVTAKRRRFLEFNDASLRVPITVI